MDVNTGRPKGRFPCQVYRFDPVRSLAGWYLINLEGRMASVLAQMEKYLCSLRYTYLLDSRRWDYGWSSTFAHVGHLIFPIRLNYREYVIGFESNYAFNIAYYSGQPILINRRVFIMVDTGMPDGIKRDDHDVYSDCGDRINIWSSGSALLGKMTI